VNLTDHGVTAARMPDERAPVPGPRRRQAEQQARSRILGGIHFQFESDASQEACVKVPEFANARFMRPLR